MQNVSETAKAHAVANGMGARIIFCRRCGTTGRYLFLALRPREIDIQKDHTTGTYPGWMSDFERFQAYNFWCSSCIGQCSNDLESWNYGSFVGSQ